MAPVNRADSPEQRSHPGGGEREDPPSAVAQENRRSPRQTAPQTAPDLGGAAVTEHNLAQVHVVLRGAEETDASVTAPWLARLTGLNAYGNRLLTSRAAIKMQNAAILLCVVLFFEWCAWSALFHTIISGGSYRGATVSLWAPTFGALVALTIFTFERGIVIADLDSWKAWFGLCFRALLVLASVIATAQPVELFAFGMEIDRELHQRGVTEAEARLASRETIDHRARAEAEKQLATSPEAIALEEARRQHDETVEMLGLVSVVDRDSEQAMRRLERFETNHKAELARIDVELETAEGDQREALKQERANKAAEHRQVRATYWAKSRDRESLRADLLGQIAALETAIERALRDYNAALREAIAHQKGTGPITTVATDAAWVERLRAAPPGQPVEDPNGQYETWDPYRVGFIERLVVLYTLGHESGPQASTDDLGGRRSFLYFWAKMLLLAVTSVIPLVSILNKFVMGEELRTYYSFRAQVASGEPTCVRVALARDADEILVNVSIARPSHA